MNSRDFKVFLYEWKSDHNATAVSRNINAAFGDGSINKLDVGSQNSNLVTRISQMKIGADRSQLRSTAGSHFSQPPIRPPVMLLSLHLMTQNDGPVNVFHRWEQVKVTQGKVW
ncbi:hypothetical protein TNCV_3831731 [Trichonephila clavipes]|nr:hypothetical protein TNCV_3831731 [Trichonephila clavipes]